MSKFAWYRDIPTWIAALGTLALAVIALFTLGPVIENLELRDKNLKLRFWIIVAVLVLLFLFIIDFDLSIFLNP